MDKIRDLRDKFFQVDDEYLNGYAKLCGINATGVYLSMCRHANKQQQCFPSKKLIAEELDISQRSVYNAMEKLKEWGIIEVEEQGRKKDGSFKVKVYTLLDKKYWKIKPQANGADGKIRHSPQANDDTTRRHVVPNKETHSEGNTYKETHIAAPEVAAPSNEQTKEDFIQKCRENKRRDINIIGAWAELTGVSFSKKDQWNLYVRRNVRAAKELSTFDDEQIQQAFSKVEEDKKNGLKYQPALETLLKKLTK